LIKDESNGLKADQKWSAFFVCCDHPIFSILIMMMLRLLSCMILLPLVSLSQNELPWNGKKCAVVLTYDDALNVHLDNVVPALDSFGLKGTFYLSGHFPGFRNRINDWRAAGASGHELANHSLFHPCIGNTPGREWVKPDYDLSTYTTQRLMDELRMTNTLLESLDGKQQRTFAYPCGDTKVGGRSYIEDIKQDFVSARGVNKAMPRIDGVDLYNVPAYGINGETGEELVALVKKAIQEKALLVFLFHGVGGEHSLNVSLEAHRELLKFIKSKEKEVWIAPFAEVTEFVKKTTPSRGRN
jgi:peptidoglycan-N-acetylglucosamine deacetylase